ncbi:MAG: YCF48-related protein, partial [Actinobacteria bacterium]|nr:YCF48-related protein [Actinomycetota bacterium]
GRSWSRRVLGVGSELRDVVFRENEGWITGDRGTLLETTNGGAVWTAVDDGAIAGISWRGVAVPEDRRVRRVVIAGEGGNVALKAENGAWKVRRLVEANLNAVAFHGGASVIAVGDAGTILFSRDAGENWTPVPPPEAVRGEAFHLRAVDVRPDGQLLIAGDLGTLLTGDAATLPRTLQQVDPPARGVNFHDAILTDEGSWAAGVLDAGGDRGRGVLFHSPNGIDAWKIEGILGNVGELGALTAIAAFEDLLWIAAESGRIVHRPDHGTERILTFDMDTVDFGQVAVGSTASLPFVLHNRGTLPLALTRARIAGDVDFAAAPEAIASIQPGASAVITVRYTPDSSAENRADLILESDDSSGLDYVTRLRGAGLAPGWREIALAGKTLRDVRFLDERYGIAVGSDGVFISADGGETWGPSGSLPQPVGELTALDIVSGDDEMSVWIAGDRGFVARSDDRGRSWKALPLPTTQNGVADIDMADTRFGYAIATSGTASQIWSTQDGGESWTFVSPPTPGVLGGAFVGDLVHVLPDRRVFTVHRNLLFSAQDPARGWTLVLSAQGSLPRQAVILEDVSSVGQGPSLSMWVVGSDGFLASGDGQRFGTIQLPGRLGLRRISMGERGSPGRLIYSDPSTGDTGVLRSDDNGATWAPDLTVAKGSEMNALATRGDPAWVVGSKSGVATVWKFVVPVVAKPPEAVVPPFLSFGETAAGIPVERELSVRNAGASDLVIASVTVEGEAFRLLDAPGLPIRPGGTGTVRLEMASSVPGGHSGLVTIASNASQPLLFTKLEGRILEARGVVIITTDPPGLEVTVDEKVHVTPAVFHDFEPGSEHALSAPEKQVHPDSGLVYVFQSWGHGEPREHTFLVRGESIVLTARYALAPGSAGGDRGAKGRDGRGGGGGVLTCGAAGDTTGLPPGPFLRLCDARLEVP